MRHTYNTLILEDCKLNNGQTYNKQTKIKGSRGHDLSVRYSGFQAKKH